MALEDRCSPQSAPSPPGLPHSPPTQSCSALPSRILDMSLSQADTATAVTATMLPHTVAASLYQQQQLQHLQQLQQLQQLHQQQLVAASAFPLPHANYDIALHQRLSLSPGTHSTSSSTPASTMTIKEEENDSIMGDSFNGTDDHINNANNVTEDEDDDIDVDDVEEERLPPPAHQQSSKPALAFSISNILSDRFGGSENNNNNKSSEVAVDGQTTKSPFAPNPASIFRPFDHARAATATPSAFTRVDLLEFSRQQQAAAAAATAAMMIERANILNCFNPAAYPRIHEEILQSRMRRTGVLPPTIAKPTDVSNTSNPCLEKSALGSLCKTVSQIGQTSVSQPASTNLAINSTNASTIPSTASSIAISSISTAPSPSLCLTLAKASLNSPPATAITNNNSSSVNSSPSARLVTKSISPQPITAPSAISRDSGMESSDDTRSETGSTTNSETSKNEMWPAWVFCTRYSDRPSSGPRYRRPKQPKDKNSDEKRPRTAFSSEQLARLKREFNENRYLTERRRQQLSSELGLNEAQIKIWFQNKRAKIKKSTGTKNPLALQLMAQGLYNHTTVPLTKEEEELEMRMNGQIP